MNSDYKIILLNTLFTMYFVFKYEFNIIIPIISLVSFVFFKIMVTYYSSFKGNSNQYDDKIGYMIYEKNLYPYEMLLLLVTLLFMTEYYNLQYFVTILLIYMKVLNYEYIRVVDDNYYLVDFKLSRTIICITMLLMCHYSQLLLVKDEISNISSIMTFLCQFELYTIDYDITIVY